MKKMKHPIYLLLISILSIAFLTYCSDDENNTVVPKTELNPNEEEEENESSIDGDVLMINNFIKENMEIYYFWNEELPDIDQEKEEDSEEYFYKLLKDPEDRWSFITDDYPALVKYFSGIEKSTGYSLQLMYLNSTSNQVIAVIEYVHPDTPAEEAGLKRGDIIIKIDGQLINDENYSDLLARTSFEITLGEIVGGNTSDLEPTIPIQAMEINLNPIVKTNIIDTLGHKIGYLAYTSFVFDYNDDLEAVIQEFKQAGVTDMVLDLRYNGGGSVATAELLGSMLVPTGNAGNVFIETVYNTVVTNSLNQDPDLPDDFFLRKFTEHESNLNLDKLYVFTTESTASASEMIIYGLEPYMDVVQIGTQTHGKYYGSITLYDEEEKHDWAIQPIVLRSINAEDNIDYTQGLIPEVVLNDYFYNYPGDLGDPEELFMAKVISVITGEPFIYDQSDEQSIAKSASRQFKKAPGLREKLYPLRNRMWVDFPEAMKP
ncbi:S41 family peptidase [Marinilabilia salmonicolor]|uniref:S41 family peptidase n=1 Tax=Marinilabilia salmonicolor TaxID=989 RepID=UPI0004680061|nr:S41 family peptidase [Marinilabilia salmonicolor]